MTSSDWLHLLLAALAIVLPLLLAGWLVNRKGAQADEPEPEPRTGSPRKD